MKSLMTHQMFQKECSFLTEKYGFLKKNKLYIRLVNGEIIQTVALLKLGPVYSTVTVGFFSLYEKIEEFQLKEGNYRLGEFGYGEDYWWRIETADELAIAAKDMKRVMLEKVCPVFERMETLSDLIEMRMKISRLTRYHGAGNIFDNFETRLEVGDFAGANEFLLEEEKIVAGQIDEMMALWDNVEEEVVERLTKDLRQRKSAMDEHDMEFLYSFLRERNNSGNSGVSGRWLETYLKTGNFEKAKYALARFNEMDKEYLDEMGKDEEFDADEAQSIFEDIAERKRTIQAIEKREMDYLNELVNSVRQENGLLLSKYGIDIDG